MKTSRQRLRDAGWWTKGSAQKSFKHESGATVTVGPTGWRAVRASGEERRGIVHMADALTWALGGELPVREVAPERAPKPRKTQPEGDWKGPVRGLLRHVSGGSVDLGGTSHSSAVATLRSGERRTFRDRADARAWVEGNGVFRPGYVPAEKRGA